MSSRGFREAQTEPQEAQWVQKCRQVQRIYPRECCSNFQLSGTGPAFKSLPKGSKKRLFGGSRWGHNVQYFFETSR